MIGPMIARNPCLVECIGTDDVTTGCRRARGALGLEQVLPDQGLHVVFVLGKVLVLTVCLYVPYLSATLI
jgi:hypothetical protein